MKILEYFGFWIFIFSVFSFLFRFYCLSGFCLRFRFFMLGLVRVFLEV